VPQITSQKAAMIIKTPQEYNITHWPVKHVMANNSSQQYKTTRGISWAM